MWPHFVSQWLLSKLFKNNFSPNEIFGYLKNWLQKMSFIIQKGDKSNRNRHFLAKNVGENSGV